MANKRPIHADRFGRKFTLPVWTKGKPIIAECASENSNFREAIELAPTKDSPGAALIRSQLNRYANRWKADQTA